MATTAPLLSTTRLKQAHLWRGASQLPKKIASAFEDATWAEFEKSYAHMYIVKGGTPRDYEECFDPWLREQWRGWDTRRQTLKELNHETLLPLDLAFSMFSLFSANIRTQSSWNKWLSLVCHKILHTHEVPARLSFLIDAMSALVDLRAHYTPKNIYYGVGYGMNQRVLSHLETHTAFALRRELCLVPQEVYDAIHAHAQRLFGTRDDALDAFLTLVFPEEQVWGDAMVERFLAEHTKRADERIFIQHFALTLLSSGADVEHMTRLFEAGALEAPEPRESWQWEGLIDLVLSHQGAALPLIARQLRTSNLPYLDEPFFLDLARLSTQPDFIAALLERMLQHDMKSTPRTKLLAHIGSLPEDVLLDKLPGLIERYTPGPTSYQVNSFEPLSKLLDNLQSSKASRQDELQNEANYAHHEDLPAQLRELPWQARQGQAGEKATAAKPSNLPAFWRPLHYPALVLREDPSLSLPIDLYDDIGRIFMDLHNEALSPAIQALEESVDPSALSDFCWHLCKDWLEVDAPAKQMWVFDTFLRFGAEELVEHLPKIIDFWIGSKLHQRGRKVLEALEPNDNPYLYEALDAMRHGGYSDGAKLSEARLNAFCSEHFAARGEDASSLQIDDFLDAHTSTHGLDTSRRLSLDTTSHVEVRLDADLEPHLVSPPGEPIALDPTATLRWELLKKRLFYQALTLSRRFERAMCSSRRWTPELWHEAILNHPILRGIAERLIWGTFEKRKKGGIQYPTSCWRIDESKEIVDLDDARQHVDGFQPGQSIGVIHPLHLTDTERERWLEVLADFEIIQPFEQITRPFITTPATKEDWSSLYGKKASYERMHDMFTRNANWEALPVIYMTPVMPGYGFLPRDRRGKPTSRLFKFELVDGIHKDPALRKERFELKKCVNLTTIKWDELDPIDCSELWYAMSSTFQEEQ